eukprot:UN06085
MASNDDEKKVNDNSPPDPSKSLHIKARSSPYSNTQQKRFPVPDDCVKWNVEFKQYNPPFYTHPGVIANHLPDAPLQSIKSGKIRFKFNELDGKIDRRSHHGKYSLDAANFNLAMNPMGRTGLCGRGWLWRWGPNHAADPIVTRWMRQDNDPRNDIIRDADTGKPILEFVAIERHDGGGWAIPGGMVDPGEKVSRTMKREFGEGTMNTFGIKDENERKRVAAQIEDFFKNHGVE